LPCWHFKKEERRRHEETKKLHCEEESKRWEGERIRQEQQDRLKELLQESTVYRNYVDLMDYVSQLEILLSVDRARMTA